MARPVSQDVQSAYDYQIQRTSEFLAQLGIRQERAMKLHNPDWGNVANIQKLNRLLAEALDSFVEEGKKR
jgi:hypothetical protein